MMPTFRIPSFLQTRRSFNRLRSFHLTPAEVRAIGTNPYAKEDPGAEKPLTLRQRIEEKFAGALIPRVELPPIPRPANLVVPLRASTIVILACILSFFFIVSISCAFIGADAGEPFFKNTLNKLAVESPGLVLIGESVDVDVDEPSITIRWSILACGDDFILPGSGGAHNVKACGLPDTPLNIFVDSDNTPTAVYDPAEIPFNRESGHRRSIQNLVQFDSDHVLDVHEARLYPFDTYLLTSSIRAMIPLPGNSSVNVPIRKLMTIDITSSFDITTRDMESYSTAADGTQEASRDIDMVVRRPQEARLFTFLLFAVSWVLTHVTMGHVFIARRLHTLGSLLPHLISSGAILVTIPNLRQSMPDAPGLDGVLIDSIGYFPQMVISSICTALILLIVVVREVDAVRYGRYARYGTMSGMMPGLPVRSPSGGHSMSIVFPGKILGHPTKSGDSVARVASFRRPPPPVPGSNATSMDIAQWDMHRMSKQLQGHYVFPPVAPNHRPKPSDASKPSHRRFKTMSKIMENGEVSHWSGESR